MEQKVARPVLDIPPPPLPSAQNIPPPSSPPPAVEVKKPVKPVTEEEIESFCREVLTKEKAVKMEECLAEIAGDEQQYKEAVRFAGGYPLKLKKGQTDEYEMWPEKATQGAEKFLAELHFAHFQNEVAKINKKIYSACAAGELAEEDIPKEPLLLAKATCMAQENMEKAKSDEQKSNAKKVLARLELELETRGEKEGISDRPVSARWTESDKALFEKVKNNWDSKGIKETKAALEASRAPKFRKQFIGESYWMVKDQAIEVGSLIEKFGKLTPRPDKLIADLESVKKSLDTYSAAVEQKVQGLKAEKQPKNVEQLQAGKKGEEKEGELVVIGEKRDYDQKFKPFMDAEALGSESSGEGVKLLTQFEKTLEEVLKPLGEAWKQISKMKLPPEEDLPQDDKLKTRLSGVILQLPTRCSLITQDTKKYEFAQEAQEIAERIRSKVQKFNASVTF